MFWCRMVQWDCMYHRQCGERRSLTAITLKFWSHGLSLVRIYFHLSPSSWQFTSQGISYHAHHLCLLAWAITVTKCMGPVMRITIQIPYFIRHEQTKQQTTSKLCKTKIHQIHINMTVGHWMVWLNHVSDCNSLVFIYQRIGGSALPKQNLEIF